MRDVADKFDKFEAWIHVNQSYATEILFISMHVTLSMPFCSLLKFPFSLINTVSFSAIKLRVIRKLLVNGVA